MGEAGVFPSLTRAFGALAARRASAARAFGLTLMAAALGGAVDAAAGRRAARARALAPGVPDLRHRSASCGRPPGSWWFRDDPREHRGVNAAELAADRLRPPAPHPRRAVGRAAAQPQPAGAVRDVLRRDLRLVLLPHLAADLSAARARLRSRRRSAGWPRCRCSASRPARWSAAGSPTRSRVASARASGCARPAWSACRSPRSRSSAAIATPDPRTAALCLAAAAGLAALGVAPGVGGVPRDRRPPRRRRVAAR